ncbi:MAG: short-chain fatty acid transporter [Spirochaetaceae bacterium]|jgi:short-chain fatty acids transporter|nr:short-chain fatty acid transporter [Spirochaetaceae bacterium]
MFKKITNACVKLVQRFLPDPFIFCIILTIITFVAAMPLTGQGPLAMVSHWGNGVWVLLAFSMQMALVLVLGSAMANSPPMKRLLKTLASIPKTAGQAIVLTTVISLLACWLNWGFGLIVGAILAKEISKTGLKVDYPLIIAAAYSGFLIWHGGFSGSIPLGIATSPAAGQAVANTGGVLTEAVSTNQTIFAWWNLLICAGLFIFLPIVNVAMHPKGDDIKLIDPALLQEETETLKTPETPAEKIENSVILQWVTIILAAVYLIRRFTTPNFSLDLNIVNLIFLTLGMIFYGRPILYVRAIAKAAKEAGPILLQFPFYAGIQGLMVGATAAAAGGTGLSLAAVISNAFVSISTQVTFPLFTFLSAGIVNFFIPSGGGQWAVQGPIMMPAGQTLGVDPALAAMSIAWGDAWTNMIQPFWALPALGVAGLGARNIMGYCLMALLVSGIIICAGFILAGVVIYG